MHTRNLSLLNLLSEFVVFMVLTENFNTDYSENLVGEACNCKIQISTECSI